MITSRGQGGSRGRARAEQSIARARAKDGKEQVQPDLGQGSASREPGWGCERSGTF